MSEVGDFSGIRLKEGPSAVGGLGLGAKNERQRAIYFSVWGRLAGGGGKTTHSVEGIFFDALQAVGLFEVRPVKIDAVTDQLGHGDAFSHGLALQPTQLLGMDLNLCAFHRLPQ